MNLSILPATISSEDLVFYFFIFCRFTGLFLISPLFSHHLVPYRVKLSLVVFSTLIIGTALWGDYRGINPHYQLPSLSLVSIAISSVFEVGIGFLIGFAYAILYEAILLGGQLIGVMIGFSVTDLIDPLSNTSSGIVGQLLVILTTLLILSLDLHHIFLAMGAESFTTLPIGQAHLNQELLGAVQQGTGRLYHHAFQVAVIPFTVLSLITVVLGFLSRILPEMNIFMIGLPLKILIGTYSLFFTIHYFPLVLRQGFNEYHNFAQMLIRYMT